MNLVEAFELVSSPSYGCSWDDYQAYSCLGNPASVVARRDVFRTPSENRAPLLPPRLGRLIVRFAQGEVSDGAQHDDGVREMLPEVGLQSERGRSKTAAASETVAGE